jgi:hypothetical protein
MTTRTRTKQIVFTPTAMQLQALESFLAKRRAVDEHTSMGAILRELLQKGLEATGVLPSGGT